MPNTYLELNKQMKENIEAWIRQLVSPSMRYEVKKTEAWLLKNLGRAFLWNWEIVRLPRLRNSSYCIIYVGRKAQRELAKALLIADSEVEINPTKWCESDQIVFVSELPFPGAMCVPSLLSSNLPLRRKIEEITANFHNQLRRDLKKNRERYSLRQVLNNDEIDRADREMLRPYATAKHGIGAAQISLDEVRRMAQKYGRFDLLLLEGEVVGCQLGHEFTRAGKRFWTSARCGYPESVFSDPKRLRDTNAMNIHLALEWAIENNYDYYDIGVALARPGDGLLEWKRRRGGELDTMGNSCYLHIRLPKVGAAQFLWDAPLFSVDRHKLTLHLGLPHEKNDEEVTSRYREMGFRGLFKVCLHCAKPPGDQLLETLRGFYAQQKSPPILEIVTSI